MTLLTAEQAATRLGRTERTVRRWITDGKLPATHPTHGHTSKFLIDESEVDKLALELAQFEVPAAISLISQDTEQEATRDTSSLLLERVNQLEQGVQEYRSMVAQLEQRLAHIEAKLSESSSAQSPATATASTRMPRATVTTEPPQNVPDGSILYSQFAKNHVVPDGTFRDQIDDGKVPAIVFSKPNRPKEKARWLTPEQQQQALAFWNTNGTIWHPCKLESCPCHDTSSQEQDQQQELEQETPEQVI